MVYQRVREVLALLSVWVAAAPLFFVLFWTWFDYWRTRQLLTYAVLGLILLSAGCVLIALRRQVFSGRFDMTVAVEAVGWAFVVVANVFGLVADRQLGFWLRAFAPFFQPDRHIKLRTTGAYGVVRHPIYAAGSLFQLGTFLLSGYPAVLGACLVWTLSALWFTRREEEHLMANLLDDPAEYVRYRARVGALFPRVRRSARTSRAS